MQITTNLVEGILLELATDAGNGEVVGLFSRSERFSSSNEDCVEV